MTEREPAFEGLLGREVVLDLASPYVILGTFRGGDLHHYDIEDGDVHDLRDTTPTRELYVRDAKQHGINPNRRRILVRREDVVSMSLLSDVIE